MSDDDLWALARKWYDLAVDPDVGINSQNAYRTCANQLENALANRVDQ